MERQATDAGTRLARGKTVPPPESVWRTQRDEFFMSEARHTTRTVTSLGVVFQLAVIGLLVDARYPTWRICALVGLYAGFVLAHRLVIARTRSANRVEHAFIAMNV